MADDHGNESYISPGRTSQQKFGDAIAIGILGNPRRFSFPRQIGSLLGRAPSILLLSGGAKTVVVVSVDVLCDAHDAERGFLSMLGVRADLIGREDRGGAWRRLRRSC